MRVLEGEIFDVAADIRPDSPTYGVWVGCVLSSENRRSVFIPAGFAHGFCVVSPEAQVVYKTTDEYAPDLEWGVRWDDPLLAIPWPMAEPRLSERDERWPALAPRCRGPLIRRSAADPDRALRSGSGRVRARGRPTASASLHHPAHARRDPINPRS